MKPISPKHSAINNFQNNVIGSTKRILSIENEALRAAELNNRKKQDAIVESYYLEYSTLEETCLLEKLSQYNFEILTTKDPKLKADFELRKKAVKKAIAVIRTQKAQDQNMIL